VVFYRIRAISGLILAVIGVYIGVALMPGMNTTISTITTPTYGVGVVGIMQVIMIVVGAAIIMMLLNSTSFA
jgi:hypothetical protein